MIRHIARGVLLKIVYPILMLAGSLVSKWREPLQGFVIGLNNRLVLGMGIKTDKILLLLPHCLQIDKCDIRLTHNVMNCKRCGRCSIKGLIAVTERTGINLYVATGGTLARRVVKEVRPKAIIAVACERDLSSGIADTYPMPVLGVPNQRPNGPCLNTLVDLDSVEAAIRKFSGAPA